MTAQALLCPDGHAAEGKSLGAPDRAEGPVFPMVVVIQYLRGLAAVLVVYAHLDTQISRISADLHLPYASIGIWGVDIFFVISGFIMYVVAIESDVGPGHFLIRRAIRIVPLYWLLTALIVAGA